MNNRYRTAFVSHGGGPLPLLGDSRHAELVDRLEVMAKTIGRPEAIVVVSAHWEEAVPSVTSGPATSLLYDYYGFPESSYSIEYPCPGAPELARTVHAALGFEGIEAALEHQRGLDHGVFVPLKIMYPDADIPVVQLSLVEGLDPALHMTIGQALRSIDGLNLLVLGSGFTFHNMDAFFAPDSPESMAQNNAFEDWLADVCSDVSLDEPERARQLVAWADAPGARFCHPREEHLLPLHVCYGLAEGACRARFSARVLGKRAGFFLW